MLNVVMWKLWCKCGGITVEFMGGGYADGAWSGGN